MNRVRAAMMSGLVLLRGWRARTPLKACARSRDSRTARAGDRVLVGEWRVRVIHYQQTLKRGQHARDRFRNQGRTLSVRPYRYLWLPEIRSHRNPWLATVSWRAWFGCKEQPRPEEPGGREGRRVRARHRTHGRLGVRCEVPGRNGEPGAHGRVSPCR